MELQEAPVKCQEDGALQEAPVRRMELREAAVRMVELQGNLARETLSVLLHLRGEEEQQKDKRSREKSRE